MTISDLLKNAAWEPKVETSVRSFLGGPGLFVPLLARRAVQLGVKAAAEAKAASSQVARVDWSECLDEESEHAWLRERLAFFDTRPRPAASARKHLLQLLISYQSDCRGLDVNTLLFPKPVFGFEHLRGAELQRMFTAATVSFGDVEARQAEARRRPHKEAEVAIWGIFSETAFPFPVKDPANMTDGSADIGSIVSGDLVQQQVEDDIRRQHMADQARSVKDLRSWLYVDYADTGLDTSLPKECGAAWVHSAMHWKDVDAPLASRCRLQQKMSALMSFAGEELHVVSHDQCTEEQLQTIHQREKLGSDYMNPERALERALKRNVSPGFLQSAPELVDRDVAHKERLARSVRDRQKDVEKYEALAEAGAACACWPIKRRWPPPAPIWVKRSAALAEASARDKDARLARPKIVSRQYLMPELHRAVKRGCPERVRSILDQGCRVHGPEGEDLLQAACALQKCLPLHLRKQDVDLGGHGVQIIVNQMNGVQVSLCMDPQQAVSSLQEHLLSNLGKLARIARRCVRLITSQGRVLRDASAVLASLELGEQPWIFSVVLEDRGSLLAAQILDLLFNAGAATQAEIRGALGLRLSEDALLAGNVAVIEILLESGVDVSCVLKIACKKWAGPNSRSQSILELLLRAGADPSLQLGLELSGKGVSGYSESLVDVLIGPATASRYLVKPILAFGEKVWHHIQRENIALCGDVDLWCELCKEQGFVRHVHWASAEMLSSVSSMARLVSIDGLVIGHAKGDVQLNEDVLIRAVENNIDAAKLITRSAWTERLAKVVLQRHRSDLVKVIPMTMFTPSLISEVCNAAHQFIGKSIAQRTRLEDQLSAMSDTVARAEEAYAEAAEGLQRLAGPLDAELVKANPLLQDAYAALDVLDKKDFGELKAFAKPPSGVQEVFVAVMHLLAGYCCTIDVDKKGRVKDSSWRAVQKMISNPGRFIEMCRGFKDEVMAGNILEQNFFAARSVLASHCDCNVESMWRKANAAAGLLMWAQNLIKLQEFIQPLQGQIANCRNARMSLDANEQSLRESQHSAQSITKAIEQLVQDIDNAAALIKAVQELQSCVVDDMLTVFRRWDINGNGTLEATELERVLIKLGLPDDEAHHIFMVVDFNKDGHVDFNEFVAWLVSEDSDSLRKSGLLSS